MALAIKAYEAQDFPQVRDILRSEYPHSLKSNERFFHWRFQRNPVGSSLGSYFLALTEGGEVAGQLGAIRDRICIRGVWHDAAWLCDLIIRPEYRSTRAALMLLDAFVTNEELAFFIGICPHMVDTYRLLGAAEISVMRTYLSVVRPTSVLNLARNRDGASHGGITRAALRVADAVIPPLQQKRIGYEERRQGAVWCEPLAEFGSEVDELLARVQPRLGITAWRSAEQLRWKFNQRPFGYHFAIAARSRSGGPLRGYTAVKMLSRPGQAAWAEIADVVTDPSDGDAFDALVGAAHAQAVRTGADFVRLRCSHPGFTSRLRLPFWVHRTRPVVDSLFACARNPTLLDALKTDPWHLTALSASLVDYGEDEWLPAAAAHA